MSNSFNNLPDSVLLEMLGPTGVDQPKEYTNELLQYLSDQELSNQVDTKVGSPGNQFRQTDRGCNFPWDHSSLANAL